jgi:CheY-like chemotaxis protein
MFKEALAQECGCPNRAYKLILMDIQMPEMDGFEATMEINKLVKQANLKNPENPIVCNILAITSYTGNDVKEKCLKLGMKQVLNKPVSSNLISEIINKYFNN